MILTKQNSANGWKMTQLKDVIDHFIVPMRDKPKELNGEIPWCRIEDFDGKYLYKSKTEQGVSSKTISEMNLKVYPVNSVLVSCSANLGKCAIVKQPLVTNQTFIGLVPSDKIDEEFLYYIMGYSEAKLNLLSSGTTISYLSRTEFENLSILIPQKVTEQQKIASILSKWDETIEAQTQLIEAKEKHKKGLMQKLLTGDVRFPGFEGEWKYVNLKNCSIISGEYGINAPGVPFNKNLPKYLRITDIAESGNKLRINNMVSVDATDSHKYILDDKDIVFARTGASVGKTYMHNLSENGHLVFAGFLIRFRTNTKVLIPEFLKQYCETKEYWDWVATTSQRSGQPGINGKEYGNLTFKIPSIKEQTKISSFLESIDQEI